MKISILTLFACLLIPNSYADNFTTTHKATATLLSSCRVEAQNVNFGEINVWAGTQQASSTMSLYCTKGASYTIALNYGMNVNDSLSVGTQGDFYRSYNGVGCGRSYCSGNNKAPDGNPYYYSSSYKPLQNGWVYNSSTKRYYALGGPRGTMVGAAKGDSISYQITLPDDTSNYWSSDTGHLYSDIGIGDIQTFPIRATATTGIGLGSSYPTPDNYFDTLTVVVTY